jgi:hypothetical protein
VAEAEVTARSQGNSHAVTLVSDEVDPRWWESVLAEAEEADRPELMSREFSASLRLQNLPSRKRAVLECLEIATSAILDAENWTQPFTPTVRLRGKRSAVPEDLSPDQVALLAHIAPLVENTALRARVADVAWCYGNRGRRDLLDIAVDAYRSTPLDYESWIAGGKAEWQRAYALLLHQGAPGRVRVQEMNSVLQQRIVDGSADDGFMLSEMSQMLRRAPHPGSDYVDTIAHHMQALAASTPDTHRRVARMLEREASCWFRLNGNETAVNHCLRRVAELYIADADSRTNQHPSVAGGGIASIEKAIAVLTSLPRRLREDCGLDDQIQELRARLKRTRVSLVDQMVRYETDPVDISEYVETARRSVAGRERFDAIAEFGDIFPVADSAALRRAARGRLDGSLAALFRSETLSHDGRKVAAVTESADDEEARAWAEAVREFGTHVELVTAGFILPAQEVLNFEHRWDSDFLLMLCVESPFVAPSQARLWATGLLHGFNGDYASAISVLIPLLENSIRLHLRANGVHTVLVDVDGVESEKGLGALLVMPEADDFLGSDLGFVLRALLTERGGPNLRNDAAHGLLGDYQAWSYGAVYVWWLCLKLVVLPVWNAYHPRANNSASVDQPI